MGQVAEIGTGATPLRSNSAFYKDGAIPWITSSALNQPFVAKPSEFVTHEALSQTNLKLYPPRTLLLAMYGEGKTRGKCSELLIEACTNQAIAAIVTSGLAARCQAFLKIFLQKNYEDIRRLSAGGVQPNLNLGLIRAIQFPLPPLAEQDRIVAGVDRLMSMIENLEAAIGASQARASNLRQAILQKAFEGRLVPQDPLNETALDLLGRIRDFRDSTPRRGTGIKPGVSTPGTGTTPPPPKPRRGGGSVQESAFAPTGLPDNSGASFLGLKPQALCPGPSGADEDREMVPVPAASVGRRGEEDADSLDLPWDAQIEHTRNATPRRGTGIKPGVSTPGTGPTPPPPKPRRGGGSVSESSFAPTGLPDLSDVPSLGLKPQALRPGPAGAKEKGRVVDVPAPSAEPKGGEEGRNFLGLPRDAQIDLLWGSLLGRGALEKEEAIRTAAQFLRDQGQAKFQRLRQGGPLYQAIATALDRGVRAGSFDRPRRGHVRAVLTDPKDYSLDEWRLCLLSSLDHEAVEEADALRAAAEWGRETLGLEFVRLREDGLILRGLREALEEAVRRREVKRVRGTLQRTE